MRKSSLSAKGPKLKKPAATSSAAPAPKGRAAELQQIYGNRAVQQLMSPVPQRAPDTPGAVDDGLRTPAQPLDANTRESMEERFGRDFSSVRVHAGADAAKSASALNANAYTVGRDVVFGPGQYAPGTRDGAQLIAHELAHVVQQDGAPAAERPRLAPARDAFEHEADSVGHAATRAELTRVPVQRVQCQQPAPAPAPVARPSLTEMRTIAQGYIGDYFSAARAGLADFEHDVASSFDWTAFWVTVGGNVIWATASFATGGTAFLISLAGIAVSTAAAGAAVTSPPDFHREAVNRTNDVITYLSNQVDRVTRAVDSEAAAGNWDDNRTRRELLGRLVKPDYIATATGGLPNLSQPAVAASIREQLLIQAAQQRSVATISRMVYQGYFEEVWQVDAIEYIQYPFSPTIPSLKPQSQWAYGLRSARFENVPPEVPNLNANLNDVYRTYGRRIDPSVWSIEKRIVLTGDPPFGVTYYLDAANNLTRWDAIEFARFLRVQGQDPDRYLRDLLRMIQAHSGPVPRTSQLG